jgi:hypothetical protein
MEHLIVTNNYLVWDNLLKNSDECLFISGEAGKVLLTTRDLLIEGWRLAVDPLQGYYTRFNPYHTVFLQKDLFITADYEEVGISFTGMSPSSQILRLEKGVAHLRDPKRPPAEDTPQIRTDYQYLDYQLAGTALRLLSW